MNSPAAEFPDPKITPLTGPAEALAAAALPSLDPQRQVLTADEYLASHPERVAVLGLGNYGTAMLHHLAAKGVGVIGWSRNDEVVRGINSEKINHRYLPQQPLSPFVKATGDLAEALRGKGIVIVAVPSQGLKGLIPGLSLSDEQLVVSLVKGFVFDDTNPTADLPVTPLNFMRKFRGEDSDLAVVSGPAFAASIVKGSILGLTAAAEKQAVAERVVNLFHSDRLQVYTSTDPTGVELSGALKNVVALGLGIMGGLGYGVEEHALVLSRSLSEMQRISAKLGGDTATLLSLAGIGDIYLTSTTKQSRNYTVGHRLGKGEKLADIVADLQRSGKGVAEGVRTAYAVKALADHHGIYTPITHAILDIFRERMAAENLLKVVINQDRRTNERREIADIRWPLAGDKR